MARDQETKRILLLEDDTVLASGLIYALEGDGYSVSHAPSLEKGECLLRTKGADLLLLDIGLPDGEGFDLCNRVTALHRLPVIFLSAREDEAHVVKGLELGADDYITKPFRLKELTARIEAVLRRSVGRREPGELLRSGSIRLDRAARRVWRESEELQVTPTEFNLLETLLRNRGRVVSRDQLLDLLGSDGRHYVEENTLSVYVSRLREKIEPEKSRESVIETVRGIGYRWN